MGDFEKINHTGGKIIIKDGSLLFTHCNFNACSMYFIAATLDGTILSYVKVGGIGHMPDIPFGSFQIPMLSDKEGYFGRQCPNCNKYFRATVAGERIYCPYCEHEDLIISFLTESQRIYIKAILNEFAQIMRGEKSSAEIDFDDLMNDFPDQKSHFVYSEENQQKRIKCTHCKIDYDIFGEFGSCPSCKRRNSFDYIEEKISGISQKVSLGDKVSELEDCLKNIVSWFEAMAKDINSIVSTYPSTTNRKKELKKINFQFIEDAAKKYKQWLDIDMFNGLSQEEISSVLKMFNIRHLLIHNGGIVDDKYIERTNDMQVRLGQRIRVSKDDVSNLANRIVIISENIYKGFCDIS